MRSNKSSFRPHKIAVFAREFHVLQGSHILCIHNRLDTIKIESIPWYLHVNLTNGFDRLDFWFRVEKYFSVNQNIVIKLETDAVKSSEISLLDLLHGYIHYKANENAIPRRKNEAELFFFKYSYVIRTYQLMI